MEPAMDEARPWHLVAPDWAAFDRIWRSPLPFALWPVCEKPLLAHWLDEAVRRRIPSVTVEAVDRPQAVRSWLDQREMWSRSIRVFSTGAPPEGAEVIVIDRLPGMPTPTPFDGPEGLLRYWLALHVEAIGRRSADMVHLDHEAGPGVWAGPGASFAPDVQFVPPVWLGNHVKIAGACKIGPEAFIGPGVFVDEDVEISRSVVCAETYVGAHTSLTNHIAQGGLLIDLGRGISVDITDSFILSSLARGPRGPGILERLLSFVAGPFLEFAARVAAGGRPPDVSEVMLGRSSRVTIRTYPSGSLLLRRAGWLRHVAGGRMRIVGILPRGEDDWERLPAELRPALENASPGVFSLADLYGCHSPSQPDEWMHAAFQIGADNDAGGKLARRNLLRILFTNPVG